MAAETIKVRFFTLKKDEIVLRKVTAICTIRRPLSPLWTGDLYLTTERLLWVRHRLSLPFPKPVALEIPLRDIRHIHIERLWKLGAGMGVETDSQYYGFSLYRLVIFAYFGNVGLTEAWYSAIAEAKAQIEST